MAGGSKGKSGGGKKKPSPDKMPPKVAQPHGGAIYAGGVPNHRGAGGRPPSALRRVAREAWYERVDVLTEIADGEASETTEIPLAVVLQHAECPNCSDTLLKREGVGETITLAGKISPRAGDRVKAMEGLARVAMSSSITADDVRERLTAMLEVLGRELDAPTFARVRPMIREVWT